jgi:predicted SAM-dependent methyltransferase
LQERNGHHSSQNTFHAKKLAAFFSLALRRKFWVKKVLKDIDLFISPSQFLLEKFVNQGLSREKIVLVPHGLPTYGFSGITRTKPSKVRFCYVGTISVHKGIYVLIDAFNTIHESAELRIYGKIPEQMMPELRKRIKNSAIHLMGELEEKDKGKVFSEIDVLIVPSIWYENCPLTINEAFLARIPVITSNIGGMAELVEDGKNGFTFPVADSKKLAEKIELFISNPGLINQFSSSLPMVKDMKTNAEEIVHLYNRLLEVKVNIPLITRVYAYLKNYQGGSSLPMNEKEEDALCEDYISGEGIEIGALHSPYPIDYERVSKIKYVDRLPLHLLKEHYPELQDSKLVKPDIIAEADQIAQLSEGTMDFIIARHLLEHLENPLSGMEEWYRILRRGGILLLIVPNNNNPFDKKRSVTPLTHIIKDYSDRGLSSRENHLREWAIFVKGKKEELDIVKCVKDLDKMGYSIHYHVWDYEHIKELINYTITTMHLSWKFEKIVKKSDEHIFFLRKTFKANTN